MDLWNQVARKWLWSGDHCRWKSLVCAVLPFQPWKVCTIVAELWWNGIHLYSVFRQVLDLIPQARFFLWDWALDIMNGYGLVNVSLSGYGSAETAQGPGSAAIPIRRSSLVTVESQDFLSQTFWNTFDRRSFLRNIRIFWKEFAASRPFRKLQKDNLPTNMEESRGKFKRRRFHNNWINF